MPLKFEWVDFGRKPQFRSDPKYPNGIDVDISNGAEKTCSVKLPYPAKRCGGYDIECDACGFTMFITTAGRADDPRSVKVKCRSN